MVQEGEDKGGGGRFSLTLHIVLGVCLRCFVVVDHLDDLEEIVLGQLLEVVRKGLHMDLNIADVSQEDYPGQRVLLGNKELVLFGLFLAFFD